MRITEPLVPSTAFGLDPSVLHLNHGSFGAASRAALVAQAEARSALEAATMRFMVREWQGRLDRARARVAAFVGADPEDLVMIPNPTAGVASIANSLAWQPGDRVVVTDHGYRACLNTLLRLVETHGIELVTVKLPLPLRGPSEVVERVVDAIAAEPRCRLALIDHITSPTGLVLDIAAIAAGVAATAPRVRLIADCAHSAGQIELDLAALGGAGVAYAVAALHKWTCAPKGSSLLWARRDCRDELRPVITSHGETPGVGPANRFHARFDWSGTHDPSAYLATPAALDDLAARGGGWPAIRARNHALALAGRTLLHERLGGGAASIAPDEMHGSMATIPVALPAAATPLGLQAELLDDGIELPLVDLPGHGTFIRISAHVYNQLADYERLADALLSRGIQGRALAPGHASP
jgi:isopenicillin-N epimerase